MVRQLALFVMLSGCSTMIAAGPHRTTSGRVQCTQSYAMPVIDAAITAVGAALVVAGIGPPAPDQGGVRHDADARGKIIAGTSMLLAFGVAAIHGFDKVERCKQDEETQTLVAEQIVDDDNQ